MATKVTESSLTCSICLRRFRKPRALPCLHSYCEECLIEYAPKGTQVLMCPLCQEKIHVPDGDVTKFKLDFRLQSQVEDAYRYEKEAGILPEIRVCNCCKDEGEAIAKCRKCGQLLCNFGVKAHESLAILGDHSITPLMDDDSDDDSNPIVQVSNYDGISDEMLEMYFENKRRSGGGEIVSLDHDQEHKGRVTIRFHHSEDAQRVLNQRSHVVGGINLTVLAGQLKKPRPKRPIDPTSIFLSGIAEDVNNKLLGLYLENCTGKDEDPDIKYGENPGTAMVTYNKAIEELDAIILKIQKKKLKGQHMSASHVYVPDCVLVTNLKPDTSQDNIELYFENERRSGGGPVREVQLNSEESQAIVYFEDYRVVSRVVERKHTVSKAVVTVSKYHDCLGATTSSDGPTSRLPKEFVTNVDRHLAAYLFEDGSPHKPGVESQMKAESAEIIWPVDDKNNTIKIRPIAQKGVTVEWRHWKNRVSQRLENIFSKFLTDEVAIGAPFYDEVCTILDSSQYQKIHPLYATKRSAILLRGPVADVKRCKEDLQRAEEELKKTVDLTKSLGLVYVSDYLSTTLYQ